jgi:hypothetical protein
MRYLLVALVALLLVALVVCSVHVLCADVLAFDGWADPSLGA